MPILRGWQASVLRRTSVPTTVATFRLARRSPGPDPGPHGAEGEAPARGPGMRARAFDAGQQLLTQSRGDSFRQCLPCRKRLLIYMATLLDLRESRVLDTIDPLEPGELPWRTLYGTMDFLRWLDEGLPNLGHNNLYSDLSPQEQLFAAFAEFVSGDSFSTDRRFKKLNCTPDQHVWEIKTDEVRVFGWIPMKDCFICCFGDSKDKIVARNSAGRYIAQTAFVRNQMNLDEPKYLTSRSYASVISNKD